MYVLASHIGLQLEVLVCGQPTCLYICVYKVLSLPVVGIRVSAIILEREAVWVVSW